MNNRQNQMIELLTENKKMEVAHLAELLSVSQVTIRKDLDRLEESGLIRREHGYATLNSRDDLTTRLAWHYEQKQKIARKAIEEVADGETIMIESGSCCALVARELACQRKGITLITNSAFIADFIRSEKTVRILLLGGELQPEAQVTVGPIARKGIEGFFVDKLFVGIDGFSEITGFTGKDYMRSEIVREMALHAEKVIIVTDSEKFSHRGIVSLISMDEVHSVITDMNIPADKESILKEHGIRVKKAA